MAITPNLGLELFAPLGEGWREDATAGLLLDENMALIDAALGHAGSSVSVNSASVANPNFVNSATVTFSVTGSSVSATATVVGGVSSVNTKTGTVVLSYSDVGADVAGAAATAQSNAEAYANGLASNYDLAGAAATAQSNAEAYANGLAGNYDPAGAAATAQSNAEASALPLAGGTLTGALLFSEDNTYAIGAAGATRPSIVYAGTSVIAPVGNFGNIVFATSIQIAGATAITGQSVALVTGQPISWNADSGISRLAADSLAIGNGTQGDFSGSLKLTGINLQGLTASELVFTDGSKNLVSGTALPNGTTATTQATGDSSTKVATDAFVLAEVSFLETYVGALYLPLAGGTMSGNINLNENMLVWENPSLGIDAGISRLGAASLAIGNGTAGDFTGSLKLKSVLITDTTANSDLVIVNTTPTVAGTSAGATVALSTGTPPSNAGGNSWVYTLAASESGAGSNGWVGAAVTITGYTGGATGNNGTSLPITASTTTTVTITNATGTATNTGTGLMVSTAVVGSPIVSLSGTINSGTAGALSPEADTWTIQSIPASVALNPGSLLSLAHSGSSGHSYVNLPSATYLSPAPSLIFNGDTTAGFGYWSTGDPAIFHAANGIGTELYSGTTVVGTLEVNGTSHNVGLISTVQNWNLTLGYSSGGNYTVDSNTGNYTGYYMGLLMPTFVPTGFGYNAGIYQNGTFAPVSGSDHYYQQFIVPTINTTSPGFVITSAVITSATSAAVTISSTAGYVNGASVTIANVSTSGFTGLNGTWTVTSVGTTGTVLTLVTTGLTAKGQAACNGNVLFGQWNPNAGAYSGIYLAVTETAVQANVNNRLIDCYAGSAGTTPEFSVDNKGNILAAGNVTLSGNLAAGNITLSGNLNVQGSQTGPYSVSLTAQAATIAATNLVAVPVTTALYEITYYLNDTTAGTGGTVSLTITWNDGAAQTFTSSNVTFGTLGAYVSGMIVVKATSGAIQYATTVTSAAGSPAYSLDIRIKQLA